MPNGENTLAWFCTYTPLEILDAAGLSPVRRFGDPGRLESADTFLHPAICPFVRACLAAEMEENRLHHAVFVNSCDGMRRLYDAWRVQFRDDFAYLMDLPRNVEARGERFLAEEFRNLAQVLADFTGTEVTAARLRAAALEREELRLSYIREADGIYGERRLRLAMEHHSGDSGVNPGDAGREGGGEGVPVLLTGNLLNPAGLVSSLGRAGARVTWIDLCNGDRAFSSSTLPQGEDMEEMLASLAQRYLGRHPCARMNDAGRRYDLLVEAVREKGARGVIYASLKFCDAYLYDFPRVQERLLKESIPVLRLESDYADGNTGQVLTRVEAFLEMLV